MDVARLKWSRDEWEAAYDGRPGRTDGRAVVELCLLVEQPRHPAIPPVRDAPAPKWEGPAQLPVAV